MFLAMGFIVTKPRKSQINLTDTPYYHCVSRCVRRAFLCGKDKYSGKSFEHRRDWVEKRLLFLSSIFAIDTCAYAVMSNHTHVVLHVSKKQANSWSDEEVLTRWHQIFKGTLLTQQYMNSTLRCKLTAPELNSVKSTISVYRKRLFSISWFMRMLNEYIAREANKEDECTGRFWEGRFKSQALLDDAALAACMAYVDLNPIRAKIAKRPESSEYTSIYRRIREEKLGTQPSKLMQFIGSSSQSKCEGIPFELEDYINLLEQTCDALWGNKSEFSTMKSASILQQVGIEETQWIKTTNHFEEQFRLTVSSELILKVNQFTLITSSNRGRAEFEV